MAWTAPAAALSTDRVASGLRFPIFVTAPPGDPRLFIVEQQGVIKIFDGAVVLPTPFLDIDPLVAFSGGEDERGLLGLAFHPDYATNGYFYVNYVNNGNDTVVKRYQVSTNPNIADPADSMTVIVFDLQDNLHRGGTLGFSPVDGYLYIGMGDGSIPGDPPGNAQSDTKLLGKMLRIDVDGGVPYAIPPDNPYVGLPPLDEIWARGLRNPYRWSFDRVTGDLYIADVGQGCWEEVDFQPAASDGGENYGWNIMEGDHCFSEPGGPCDEPGCSTSGLVLPIHEYSHGGQPLRCSITGGNVYRGSDFALRGTYFFADFCTHQIWSFRYVNSTVTEFTDRTAELDPGGGLQIQDVAGFGEDGLGELYIVDRGTGTDGEIYQLIAPGTGIQDGAGGGPAVAAMPWSLSSAQPNPFSGSTSFRMDLPGPGRVTVSIFGLDGRLVRRLASGAPAAGSRTFAWDGLDGRGKASPSGIYFLRAEAEGEARTQRLCLVR
jgi:glucose/arabinose dehydrogenase